MAEGEAGAVAAVRPERLWEDLRYGSDGLVPVVVQHAESGRVLMVGWADREAVRRTVAERRAYFWSRSRRQLWRKGETSGHTLDVQRVLWDCDADTLIYQVRPNGPVCHTGQDSCFFRGESVGDLEFSGPSTAVRADAPLAGGLGEALTALVATVAQRRATMPEGSYVAELLRAGALRALQKVGEEAVELVIAGTSLDRAPSDQARRRLVSESADLLFHTVTAWAALGVDPDEVAAELVDRQRSRPVRRS